MLVGMNMGAPVPMPREPGSSSKLEPFPCFLAYTTRPSRVCFISAIAQS